jgi:hypothetical protein
MVNQLNRMIKIETIHENNNNDIVGYIITEKNNNEIISTETLQVTRKRSNTETEDIKHVELYQKHVELYKNRRQRRILN